MFLAQQLDLLACSGGSSAFPESSANPENDCVAQLPVRGKTDEPFAVARVQVLAAAEVKEAVVWCSAEATKYDDSLEGGQYVVNVVFH